MEKRTATVEIREDEFSNIQNLIEARIRKLKGDNKRLIKAYTGKATNLDKRQDNDCEIEEWHKFESKLADAFI